jgi:hypothetical protein
LSLVSEYTNLLIKQYWEKPKAKAEIQLKAETWDKTRAFLASLDDAFDLDLAVGAQLDVLGRIVGIPREVPEVVEKTYFGFTINPDSLGFADRFNALRIGGPFFDRFSSQYTALQLNDNDYRFFIRVKVALNWASAYVSSDERISIQDVILSAFNGRAYVVDNLNMTLTLYVSPVVSLERIRLIRRLNLLPKPQGVRYRVITQAEPGFTFGFAANPNSKGFADKFDPSREGGFMARKVI